MRLCFSRNIPELIGFASETGKVGREKQKSLLRYGLEVTSNSTSIRFGQRQFVTVEGEELEFAQKFSPFLTPEKLPQFYDLLNIATYHIERNAHAPTLFLDLSMKITGLINE